MFTELCDAVHALSKKYFTEKRKGKRAKGKKAKGMHPLPKRVKDCIREYITPYLDELDDREHRPLLMEAFIWYELRRYIFNPASYWSSATGALIGGYLAEIKSRWLSFVTSIWVQKKKKTYSLLLRTLANSIMNTKLSCAQEEPSGFVAHASLDQGCSGRVLFQGQGRRNSIEDALKIIGAAGDLELVFRRALPDWVLWPNYDRAKKPPFPFDGGRMETAATNAEEDVDGGGLKALVRLVYCPGLVKYGDNNSERYSKGSIIKAAKVDVERVEEEPVDPSDVDA
ncbi:hypothetical protein B0T22DRAFT_459173 [Podospora appendiculata]|uniref:Uncharacterized protein n=1 Tax=Podospora appendiculata TaxID=314037 RepID=A0AAE0X9S9_9PEZI|nr:hypothetical protein B0T22DRAFT_459173 [Podospora appendiculata]